MGAEMDLLQASKEFLKLRKELAQKRRLKTLRKILKFLLIGFFILKGIDEEISALIKKQQGIMERIRIHVHDELETISITINQVKKSGTFLIFSEKEACDEQISSLESKLPFLEESEILNKAYISQIRLELTQHRKFIAEYNEKFVEKEKKEYSHLWKKDCLLLDDEQQTAIVTDDKHNLVVAAAGSGKTEVLITRIAYLNKRKPSSIKPWRILAIAYQNKDVNEIKQRLNDHYGISKVNVSTFHKLGKNILEKAGKNFKHTDIVSDNKKHEVVTGIFKQRISEDPEFYSLFLRYSKYFNDVETEVSGCGDTDDIVTYAKERSYFAINGKNVNSRAEKEILDFFLTTKLNGEKVLVQYEPDVNGFRPDFYLPKYDIYLEHWALDENGEVPKWFNQTSEDYRKKMEWKRQWFSKHSKPLVETYSYEYDERDPEKFIEILKSRVLEKLQMFHAGDFRFTSMTYNEIIGIVWGPDKDPVDDICSFIKNAKVYGLRPEKVEERLQSGSWARKQRAFGHLANIVFSSYERELKIHGKIDFEDMINGAIEDLSHNQRLYNDTLDHILIDEYQDISAQRYKLVRMLLERNPKCRLFCVGDDWQNIMAFAGSNLNFFVKFHEYFDHPAVTKIRTNFRSVETIVDAGAALIRNNGDCQIPKAAYSSRKKKVPIKIIKSGHGNELEKRHHEHIAQDCIGRVIKYLQIGIKPKDILILSRFMRIKASRGYRFVQIVNNLIEEAKDRDVALSVDNPKTQSKVRLLTAHKSKGLEAKIVLILNVTKGLYGFPCEIDDPSIFAPARQNYPEPNAKKEERRLFYVGMTRAKDELILYTWDHARSEFLEEISAYTYEEPLGYKFTEIT